MVDTPEVEDQSIIWKWYSQSRFQSGNWERTPWKIVGLWEPMQLLSHLAHLIV